MSNGSAIVARLGIDTRAMKRNLAEAEAMVKASGKRMAAAHGGGGHGGTARTVGDSLDALTGQQGWVMRANMLSHSLPLAAFAGLVLGIKETYEATNKLNEATAEANRLFGKSNAVLASGGPGSVTAALKERTKAIDKLKEGRGFLTTLSSLFGSDANKKSFGAEIEGEASKTELIEKFNAEFAKTTQRMADAEASGEREVELLKNQLQLEEKIAKIKTESAGGIHGVQIERAEQEAAVAAKKIEAKFDKQAADEAKQRAEELRKQDEEKAKQLEKYADEFKTFENAKAEAHQERMKEAEKERKKAVELAEQEKKRFREVLRERQIEARDRLAADKQYFSERSKGTLGELAAHARNSDGAKARHAERIERRAERERMRGHMDKAGRLFAQEDALKGGIRSLKDSEKEGYQKFKDALEAAQSLKDIKDAIDKIPGVKMR
jgi:hypothetical protein